MTRRISLAAALVALATACAPVPKKDYSRLYAAQPRSILIVPVMNKSVNVDAPDYFLSTTPIPVAERGYYVFPVNLVKRILEDDGLADAGLVHGADPARLAAIFGADAVLYVSIERWDARYVLLATSVTVELSYVLKDGRTGDVLWVDRERMVYQTGDGGAGLLGAIINAAVEKASPSYMPLARQANAKALAYPGPGLPAGPYLPEYRQDWIPPAGSAQAPAPTGSPGPSRSAAPGGENATTPAALPR